MKRREVRRPICRIVFGAIRRYDSYRQKTAITLTLNAYMFRLSDNSAQEPLSPFAQARQGLAFALSALLSPYLVIPVGTVAVVASVSYSRRESLIWTLFSILFSTIVPALFVIIQIWREKITDVHVMEREQRGGPFLVAIFSSAPTLPSGVSAWCSPSMAWCFSGSAITGKYRCTSPCFLPPFWQRP